MQYIYVFNFLVRHGISLKVSYATFSSILGEHILIHAHFMRILTCKTGYRVRGMGVRRYYAKRTAELSSVPLEVLVSRLCHCTYILGFLFTMIPTTHNVPTERRSLGNSH